MIIQFLRYKKNNNNNNNNKMMMMNNKNIQINKSNKI